MAIMQTAAKIKTQHVIIILALLAVSIGGRIYAAYWPNKNISINGVSLKVLVADTEKHRFIGLGGRDDWGRYQGMIFIFPDVGQHAIVMRDMRFSIDIVWADDGRIIDTASNVPTEIGYREEQLTPYFSRLPSDMVIELPAGWLKENGIKIGDRLEIDG